MQDEDENGEEGRAGAGEKGAWVYDIGRGEGIRDTDSEREYSITPTFMILGEREGDAGGQGEQGDRGTVG